MRLYLDHSSKAGEPKLITHTLHVCPAGDLPGECPSEWVDSDGSPLTFQLRFANGVCDTAGSGVPDSVAKYAISRGLATKSRPLLRVFA